MKSSKYLSPLIITFLLLGALIPFLAGVSADSGLQPYGMDDHMGPDQDEWGDHAQDHMNYVSDGKPWEMAGEEMEAMFNESVACGLFGNISFHSGMASGHFVSFQFDESSGLFNDYTMKDGNREIHIFDSIQFEDSDIQTIDIYGSIIMIGGDSTRIMVHDNPVGLLHATTEGSMEMTFDLAAGMKISEDYSKIIGADSESIVIFSEGFRGVLMTADGHMDIDQEDSTITVNIASDNGSLIFRAKPMGPHNMHHEQVLMEAFMKGRIGGEASVMVRNGSAIANTMSYQHQFQIELMEAQRNNFEFNISSEGHEGKVVLVNVDSDSLKLDDRKISVSIDGKDVSRAYNLLDVLYSNGTALEEANYMVVQNNSTTQLMVYIPSFSAHTLTIETYLPGAEVFGAEGIIALIAGVAIIGIAAAGLIGQIED